MHAVLRTYSGAGAQELFDLLERNMSEVETIMRAVEGFVSYTLVRTAEGGFSLTVNQDEAGAEESVRKAGDWVKQNASSTSAQAPKVSHGSVITHVT